MNEVIKGFFLLATCSACSLKILSLKFNILDLERLFAHMHDAEFKPLSLEEQRIFLNARQLSHTTRNSYGAVSVCALTTLLLTQCIIDNTQLPLDTYDPFQGERGSFGFCFMYVNHCCALSSACFINIAFDSLCCSIFIFIRCQLDIFALRLQSIGKSLNSEVATDAEMLQQLKHCIHYHKRIIELTSDIEAIVYKPISVQIFCSVLVLTANFYSMSQSTGETLLLLKMFIYQSCMLLQIFIICYFAGEITERSYGLPHDLYKSNWVGAHRTNQRLLLMLMLRLDLPLRIKTLNSSHSFDLMLFSSGLQPELWPKFFIIACKVMSEHHEITSIFYKYQVWYFNFLGVWQVPRHATRCQRWLHQLRFCLILGIVAIMLLFFAIRVLANIDQLNVILEVFFMFATEVSCMSKLLSIKLRNRQHARLIEAMHSSCFRPGSKKEALIFRNGAERSIKWRNFYAYTSLLAASLILVMQWFVDNNALPLSMYEPCNLLSSGCYYGLYFYQVMSLMPTCWLNIAFDSIASSLLYFLETQLAMLASHLENLGTAVTDEDNLRIARELRNCCIHYARIFQLKDLIDGFIKVPGSVQMLCSVLVLVSNFYAISIRTKETAFMIMMASYQFVMLLQIFIICYSADEMSYQSAMLSHSLYSSDWTSWNKSNRKLALLMMLRFSEPLHMHTLNHSQCFNSTTFSSIVNCSYSYFALLKRVNS
ncbi:PREDICTED: odorant receptor 46a [Drosophila arizonae]|uniref:Odorant receptor 46a n=1 Tax=Drosophila arizonae TaxID=7263 RepID=A0ABM1PBD5_DROAR|nr:PREDICTED: odorant receptor 46a [Drosophila arizonae]